MKLKDMSIGTQLRLGLGAIFTLVVLLGIVAWKLTDNLWLQTETMYEHPLPVSNAVAALKADYLAIHRDMKGLLLAANDVEFETAHQSITIFEADAMRQLETIRKLYLGPPSDYMALQEEFLKWNAIHGETIRLLRAGRTTEAAARTRAGGVGGNMAKELQASIQVVDDFAHHKADQLYATAKEQKAATNRHLVTLVTIILMLTLLLSYLLLRHIREPLQQLTRSAEQFRGGDMNVRSKYESVNEFGLLSAVFNGMATAIAAQIRVGEQAASLAGILSREMEIHTFCREILQMLVAQTGSRIGAVYLLNAEKTAFEHFESIGMNGGWEAFSAGSRDGEFGMALATGRMQHITAIPEDTRFTFATVSGEFRPREIITLPLTNGNEVIAVLSLAGIHPYGPEAIRLLEVIHSGLAARMNGVLAYGQIQDLARRLDLQNRELDAQKQELIAQSRELVEQNTRLEMQKQQLDEANRLKSTFLSNMSHELRTPLNSVIALTGVLGRRLKGKMPDEEFGYLEVIERNGRHLLSLINDILDLSRIEAGREEISPTVFGLRRVVAEIAAMLEPQALEKGIALENRVDEALPPVTSDYDKVLHILQNLVANAVKFTEAGFVKISARLEDDVFQVDVRDTGIGIAAEQLEQIFDEFRQADDSASRKHGGTGLGLTIARKYAELLNGGITVTSTPGSGSIFTLHLPLDCSQPHRVIPAGGPAEEAPRVPCPAIAEASDRGRRILLVDDSKPAVIQLTDILNAQGYEVLRADNGRDAMTQIESDVPDAVILDLMMPLMDGFEVLRQIRDNEKTVCLPVLILTAKHVTREEMGFLKGNHIHQLIQKGDINKAALLSAVAGMFAPSPAGTPRMGRPRLSRNRDARPLLLVVEDHPDNRRTIRALLQEAYDLIEADGGEDGLEKARVNRPDLILMDITLPGMDGYATLDAIRRDATLRDTPVVAVTADAMKGRREEILKRGFDGYISKPIDETALWKVLHEALYGEKKPDHTGD